ncbi:hypothetical protein KR093_007474 [Drosophila rubida]|uniref:Hexosyltransferase n=1 Tax=Drosophila rubida TaxID=30044 RepID=A0AAD4K6G0_9MUSC|nr:hypothetical protein KR093_007474 [Drosophila rubida]
MAIRQTWGHYAARRDIGIAFVLGRGLNKTQNKAISWENYLYGDLIRGNYIDTYYNLTLKTMSILEWANQHCYRAKYLLKTDDDVFINVPKLFHFVEEQLQGNVKRTIFGRLAKRWPPVRNKKSKYFVSYKQYRGVYPTFVTGPAYLMTIDIVHALYVRALTTIYLNLEDVFITGIVAESLGIKRVQIGEFVNRRIKLTPQNIHKSISIHMISWSEQFETVYLKLEDVFTTGIVAQSLGIERLHVNEFVNRRISFNPCNIRNAISVHMIKSNEQFDLWKKLLDQTTKCK